MEIVRFPIRANKEVNEYSNKLAEKEDELQSIHLSLSRQLRTTHITDMIRQNKDNREEVNQARRLTTGDCDILQEMVVVPTGLY